MASVDTLVLTRAGLVTVGMGVVATVIATITEGGHGLVGAVLATLIVVVFFSAGQLVLGRVIASNPQMALTAALMIYLVKIGILLALLILLSGATFFDPKAFGLTIVACTITWTCLELWVYSTAKVLYVQPGSGPGAGDGAGDGAGSPPTPDVHPLDGAK